MARNRLDLNNDIEESSPISDRLKKALGVESIEKVELNNSIENNKNKYLQVPFTLGELKKLESIANEYGLKPSKLVSIIVKQFLSKEK